MYPRPAAWGNRHGRDSRLAPEADGRHGLPDEALAPPRSIAGKIAQMAASAKLWLASTGGLR
jgi:hypothetical protein